MLMLLRVDTWLCSWAIQMLGSLVWQSPFQLPQLQATNVVQIFTKFYNPLSSRCAIILLARALV